MPMRIVINGREVRNPVIRGLAGLFAAILLALFGALVVLLAMSVLGFTLVMALGVVAALVLAPVGVIVTRRRDNKRRRRLDAPAKGDELDRR